MGGESRVWESADFNFLRKVFEDENFGYSNLRGHIRKEACRRGVASQDVSDVVHEVMIRLSKTPKEGFLRPEYIRQRTRWFLRDEWDKRRRRPLVLLETAAKMDLDALMSRASNNNMDGYYEGLNELIKDLPEPYASTARLIGEGYSVKGAAEHLGVLPNTIKSRLKKIGRDLSKSVAEVN